MKKKLKLKPTEDKGTHEDLARTLDASYDDLAAMLKQDYQALGVDLDAFYAKKKRKKAT